MTYLKDVTVFYQYVQNILIQNLNKQLKAKFSHFLPQDQFQAVLTCSLNQLVESLKSLSLSCVLHRRDEEVVV